MVTEYKLYGHEVSLFSGKTRAYLRHKDIPFSESLSAENRAEIKEHIGRNVIPVVRTPSGDYLQDTTVIIDALEQQFPDKPVYPTAPFQRLVSLLMEVYAEEWLILPAMHYRWAFKRQNLLFILKEFGHA
ncbi:MAG: glutathione S-transferase N-terminal domain-containing protein, partial [Kordiimonas sp.]